MRKSGFSSEEIAASIAEETDHEPGVEDLASDGLTIRQETEIPEGVHLPKTTAVDGQTYGESTGGMHGGEFSIDGQKGDTPYFSDHAEVNEVTGGEPIPFKEGYADFSEWSQQRVNIPIMGDNASDQRAAKIALGQQMAAENPNGNLLKPDGSTNQSAVNRDLQEKNAVLHHEPSFDHDVPPTGMSVVDRRVHDNVPHSGGASQMRNWPSPTEEADSTPDFPVSAPETNDVAPESPESVSDSNASPAPEALSDVSANSEAVAPVETLVNSSESPGADANYHAPPVSGSNTKMGLGQPVEPEDFAQPEVLPVSNTESFVDESVASKPAPDLDSFPGPDPASETFAQPMSEPLAEPDASPAAQPFMESPSDTITPSIVAKNPTFPESPAPSFSDVAPASFYDPSPFEETLAPASASPPSHSDKFGDFSPPERELNYSIGSQHRDFDTTRDLMEATNRSESTRDFVQGGEAPGNPVEALNSVAGTMEHKDALRNGNFVDKEAADFIRGNMGSHSYEDSYPLQESLPFSPSDTQPFEPPAFEPPAFEPPAIEPPAIEPPAMSDPTSFATDFSEATGAASIPDSDSLPEPQFTSMDYSVSSDAPPYEPPGIEDSSVDAAFTPTDYSISSDIPPYEPPPVIDISPPNPTPSIDVALPPAPAPPMGGDFGN